MGCNVSKHGSAVAYTPTGSVPSHAVSVPTTARDSPSASMPDGLPSARAGSSAPAPTCESMPRRAAVLRWPDGRKTSGTVAFQSGLPPAFFAAEVDGPLEERCHRHPEKLSVRPGPIDVDVATTSKRTGRVLVKPRLMEEVPGLDASMLKRLAEVAGGGNIGSLWEDEVVFSHLMLAALRHIEDDCTDPDALGRALRTLERPFQLFTLASVGEDDAYETTEGGVDEQAAQELAQQMRYLAPSEQLLVRVRLVRWPTGCDKETHRVAVAATRLSDTAVRLSVINPNGWSLATGDNDLAENPIMAKTVSLDEACIALEWLRSGAIDPPQDDPRSTPGDVWRHVAGGAALHAWLSSVNPDTPMQETPPSMPPQKGADCVIEQEFAWLASVLPKADYKLAKANVLNALVQAAKANDIGDEMRTRLGERLTSSLSARAMETGT